MVRQNVQLDSKRANSDLPGVQDVDPQEVHAKRSSLVVIDVRRPNEFSGELGHIPGAKLIVLDTLEQNLETIPKDQLVVFVCLSGGRSARACAFAQEHGFAQVFNLKGGMKAWNQLGYEVNFDPGDDDANEE